MVNSVEDVTEAICRVAAVPLPEDTLRLDLGSVVGEHIREGSGLCGSAHARTAGYTIPKRRNQRVAQADTGPCRVQLSPGTGGPGHLPRAVHQAVGGRARRMGATQIVYRQLQVAAQYR